MSLLISGELEWMIFKGPFQTKPFYECMIPEDVQTHLLPPCSLPLFAFWRPENQRRKSTVLRAITSGCCPKTWFKPSSQLELPPSLKQLVTPISPGPFCLAPLSSWSWQRFGRLCANPKQGASGTAPAAASSLHSHVDPWRWHMGRAAPLLPGSLGDKPQELQPSEVTAGWCLGSFSPWA